MKLKPRTQSPHSWNLKSYEIQAFIDHVMFYMDGVARRKLMNELPQVYNKICGKEIVTIQITPSDQTGG